MVAVEKADVAFQLIDAGPQQDRECLSRIEKCNSRLVNNARFFECSRTSEAVLGARTGSKKPTSGRRRYDSLMLTLFVRLICVADYKPLYKDLDPADAQALATQLDAQNIPHQVSADGKEVSVPADKLDAARMMTATQGQPHSGRMGFELFDKMSWGQTEF